MVVTVRSRGRLPHWEADRATYFVTFRLADSLPASVLAAFRQQRDNILATTTESDPRSTAYQHDKLLELFDDLIERHLDAGAGSCHLAEPAIADMVEHALRHFEGQRYSLRAWSVMPNHVHVVFTPQREFSLAAIIHSWKSYTAVQANRMLGRQGSFWQREYYDHLVRDNADFDRIVLYVLENPRKAGLLDWRWVGSL
jgi:REP element-mobilizing transposase RayT